MARRRLATDARQELDSLVKNAWRLGGSFCLFLRGLRLWRHDRALAACQNAAYLSPMMSASKSEKKPVAPREFHAFVPISVAPCDRRLLVSRHMFRVRDRLVLPNTSACRRDEHEVRSAICDSVRRLSRVVGHNLKLSDDFLIWFHNLDDCGAYVIPLDYGNRVFLNWPMFQRQRSLYLNDVIPHEVAHLFQHVLARKETDHGPVWRGMMNKIGARAEHAYSFDFPKKRPYRTVYVYDCGCQQHVVSRQQHLAIGTRGILRGRGSDGYCTDCGNDVRFLYESFCKKRTQRIFRR